MAMSRKLLIGDFLLFQNIRKPKVYRPRKVFEDEEYHSRLRFTVDSYDQLHDYFEPLYLRNFETRGGALDFDTKLKIFLRTLSTSGFQIGNYTIYY